MSILVFSVSQCLRGEIGVWLRLCGSVVRVVLLLLPPAFPQGLDFVVYVALLMNLSGNYRLEYHH